MYIRRVRIQNFRSLKDLGVDLKPGLNLFVGENNSGKSSLLHAIERTLARNPFPFELRDFYAEDEKADPRRSPPITIDVQLRPTATPDGSPAEFSENFTSDFSRRIDFDAAGDVFLQLRLRAVFEPVQQRIVPTYFTVNAAGSETPLDNRDRMRLWSYTPFYMLNAFRDATEMLGSARSLWGRLLRAIPVDPSLAQRVSATLGAVNADIVDNTPRLQEIQQLFQQLGGLLGVEPGPESIKVHPVPPETSDLLRSLDILIKARGSSSPQPLDRHGEGLRSMAVLTIFRIFVTILAQEETENDEAEPILAVEEPEVHLHPHLHRATAGELVHLAPQVLVTTHSPHVASACELGRLFVIRRPATSSAIRGLSDTPGQPFLSEEIRSKLRRYLLDGGADVFFARCVLIVEGDSEQLALPLFAKALGYDLDTLGVTVLSLNGQDHEPYLRLLHPDAYSIPWAVLSDADGNALRNLGSKLRAAGYITDAQLNTARAANRLREDVLLPHNCFAYADGEDFELMLLNAGVLPEYQAVVNEYYPNAFALYFQQPANQARLVAADDITKMHVFLKSSGVSKPFCARVVAERLTQNGTDASRVPPVVRTALERTVSLAQ